MNYIYTSVIKYKGVKAAFLVESVFVVDSLKVKAKLLSRVQLFVTPWTVACQAPPSMGLFRQEYWSGLPCPPPGNQPDPGIKPVSLTSSALAGGFFTTSTTWEARMFASLICFFPRASASAASQVPCISCTGRWIFTTKRHLGSHPPPLYLSS